MQQPELLDAPIVFRDGAQNWLDTYKPTTEVSVMPNILARGPIFSAFKSRDTSRTMLDKDGKPATPHKWHDLLCYVGGDRVEQHGPSLRQEHLTLWLTLIKLSLQPEHQTSRANVVSFGQRDMLRRLGRGAVGGSSTQAMRDLLEEMMHTKFRITTRAGYRLTSSLVLKFVDTQDGRSAVMLDPDLIHLFAGDVTAVNLDERLQLAGRESRHVLAQWLHAFFSTHRDPQDINLQKLQVLSGRTGEFKDFRKLLVAAIHIINDTLPTWYCAIDKAKLRVAHGKDGLKARQARLAHTAELEKAAAAKATRAAKRQKKQPEQATPSSTGDLFSAAPAPAQVITAIPASEEAKPRLTWDAIESVAALKRLDWRETEHLIPARDQAEWEQLKKRCNDDDVVQHQALKYLQAAWAEAIDSDC